MCYRGSTRNYCPDLFLVEGAFSRRGDLERSRRRRDVRGLDGPETRGRVLRPYFAMTGMTGVILVVHPARHVLYSWHPG